MLEILIKYLLAITKRNGNLSFFNQAGDRLHIHFLYTETTQHLPENSVFIPKKVQLPKFVFLQNFTNKEISEVKILAVFSYINI